MSDEPKGEWAGWDRMIAGDDADLGRRPRAGRAAEGGER